MWIFLVLIALYVLYRIFAKESPKKPSVKTSEKSSQSDYLATQNAYKKTQNRTSSQSQANTFQTFIAGIPHRFSKEIQLSSLISVGQKLELQREASNKYDKNAVKILSNGVHIGYIPKEDNLNTAKHLDAGQKVIVSVISINDSDIWRGARITINLI